MGNNPLRLRRLVGWLLIGFVITQPLSTALAGQNKQPVLAKVPEPVFRRLINKLVIPVYPDGAKKRGEHGVAVAQIRLDEQGNLTDVQVLESPSGEIGEAVTNAVRQCKFKAATTDDGPVLVEGKLTFYFVIEGGRGRVENPKKFK